MSETLKISTLGGLSIQLNGRPLIGFHSRKVEALIVYLACMREPQSRESLADLLWDEQTQASANLRVLLTDLRQFLAPYFEISRTSVALNPQSEVWLDSAEFAASFDRVRRQRQRQAPLSPGTVSELEKGLEFYRGDFLKGFFIRESPRFEEWVLLEQERLRRLAVTALQQLVNYYLEQQDYRQGIETAARLFQFDPLDELAHQQMMQLLAHSGEYRAALVQYDRYKQLLTAELNTAPSPETTALRDRILNGSLAVPIKRGSYSVPRALTPFVGRTDELRALDERLRDPEVPLVALVGPAGVGKTRLALRAAEQVRDHFRDGVVLVALASMSDEKLVAAKIAETIDLMPLNGSSPLAHLKRELRDKELLLVIDHFDRVLGAGHILTELLAACPHLKVLVTSRERLHLYGEYEFRVAPLPCPELTELRYQAADLVERVAGYPSVALFVQRASAVQSDFKLTPANARAVAEICARLDGLPLAIELAAARTKLLPPHALLARLTRRLDFLTGGGRDQDPRQQSLRAALDWSYAALTADEQTLFRRLAVFAGSFDAEMVEQIKAVPVHDAGGGRMKDEERTLDSFPKHQSSIVNRQSSSFISPSSAWHHPSSFDLLSSLVDKSLVQRIEQEGQPPRFTLLETIREYARERLDEHQETAEVQQQHALYFLRLARQAETHFEGPAQVEWFKRCELELDNLRAALQWALANQQAELGLESAHALGRFWTVHDHWAEGRRWLERLLALPDVNAPTLIRAQASYSAGLLANWMTDYAAARTHLERAQTLALRLEEERLYGQVLGALATVLQSLGDAKGAAAAAEQSEELLCKSGAPLDEAWANASVAGIRLYQGNFQDARRRLEHALALFKRAGDVWGRGVTCGLLALVARLTGDAARSSEYKQESIRLLTEVGDQARIGILHYYLGSPSNAPQERDKELAYFQDQVRLHTQHNDKEGMATALMGLATALHRRGDDVQAETLYKESLVLCVEIQEPRAAAECLEGLAGIAAVQHCAERAARLFGAAESSKRYIGGFLGEAQRATFGNDLALARAQIDELRFNELWQEGRAWSLDEAIEYALTAEN